ncbi:uncharacterized protein [Amphiura filiformis]|uniref:uncharacterized protein n=1 Tax=Amphiura filiformis TaxID=82378 RepID=UPI003B2213B0
MIYCHTGRVRMSSHNMAVEPTTEPLKVFIWSTGRSLSNAFLKCMTYVPDTIAWHEPYSKIGKFSDVVASSAIVPDAESRPVRNLVKNLGGASAVAKIESGYDASDKDYDWLKEQLESDLPDGKTMLFVKDNGAIIGRLALHDKIPKGFRHTFLIRNPKISIMSRAKMYLKTLQTKSVNLDGQNTPFFQKNEYLNALWKYVKSEGLESRPVIIDVDDLLENPKEILEAYCKEIGIPFTEDLLTWPAGDEVMTKLWMVPKQSILIFRILGFGDKAFAHTEFKKLPVPAFDGSSKDDEFMNMIKQFPSTLPISMEDVKEVIDSEMPYYEEMFSKRLTVNK